jgi:serine/threonine protein kinase
MENLVGKTIGPYKISSLLGKGSMAMVYKAYQPSLERYVALKVLPAELQKEPGFSYRFRREARTAAKLEHPHILAVYDFGQEHGLSYIAMRYVEAGTLQDLIGETLDLWHVADLVGQIADALDYAHEHGIVHRDVKPTNVLLYRDNYVLLADFGLAKALDGTQQITATGVVLGTPAYMSPEQARGEHVDQRSDVYSLGVILFELLTGQLPFEADTPLDMLMRLVSDPVPFPREINPSIPVPLEMVLMKALAKLPEERYQSAGELAQAFRDAIRDAKTIELSPPTIKAGELEGDKLLVSKESGGGFQFKKHWWIVLPIAIVVVLAIVLSIVLF